MNCEKGYETNLALACSILSFIILALRGEAFSESHVIQ